MSSMNISEGQGNARTYGRHGQVQLVYHKSTKNFYPNIYCSELNVDPCQGTIQSLKQL